MSTPRIGRTPGTATLTPDAATDTARVVLALYTAFNDRDFDRGAAHVAPDQEMEVVATGERFHGPQGYRDFAGHWATAFPDARVEIRTVVTEGDRCCVEFHGVGTHDGPFRTPGGTIPATGRPVEIPFCDVWEVRDGLVQRGRTYFDVSTIMRQLGLLT
jgi:steroid delta-isomerase-like uncharacterized protein